MIKIRGEEAILGQGREEQNRTISQDGVEVLSIYKFWDWTAKATSQDDEKKRGGCWDVQGPNQTTVQKSTGTILCNQSQ